MSAPVKPGDLRERVAVETPQRSPDGAGGVTEAWIAKGAAWAQILPRGAEAQERAQAIETRRRYRVTVRSDTTAVPGDRLVWKGRRLLVTASALVDATGRFMRLDCEERPSC